MSELFDAVEEMTRAAHRLSPHVKHTCDYHMTDSPEGDVCTCDYNGAIKAANAALNRLRGIAGRERSALELGAAVRRAGLTGDRT